MIIRFRGKEYDTKNLPAWAQEHIANLERERDHLLYELERTVLQDEKTSITVDDLFNDKRKMYLPDNSRIKFTLGEKSWHQFVEVYYCQDIPGYVEIHGGGSMEIRPWYSNTFRVKPSDN